MSTQETQFDVWEEYPLPLLVLFMCNPLLIWCADGVVYWSNR